MKLQGYINTDKLHCGGQVTHNALFVLEALAESSNSDFHEHVLDILDEIVDIDFQQLDRANKVTAGAGLPAMNVDLIFMILNGLTTYNENAARKKQTMYRRLLNANPWFEDWCAEYGGIYRGYKQYLDWQSVSDAANSIRAIGSRGQGSY